MKLGERGVAMQTKLVYMDESGDDGLPGKQCCLEEKWNYFLISDKGRLGTMRKAAKKIPNQYMIEEVFEKDSADSFFIQLCDYVACMTRLYYEHCVCGNAISSRYSRIIDTEAIQAIFAKLNNKSFCRLVVVPK